MANSIFLYTICHELYEFFSLVQPEGRIFKPKSIIYNWSSVNSVKQYLHLGIYQILESHFNSLPFSPTIRQKHIEVYA